MIDKLTDEISLETTYLEKCNINNLSNEKYKDIISPCFLSKIYFFKQFRKKTKM